MIWDLFWFVVETGCLDLTFDKIYFYIYDGLIMTAKTWFPFPIFVFNIQRNHHNDADNTSIFTTDNALDNR